MRNLKNKSEKGITLIALVITIVVLIILAAISINAVIGQGGIIEKAKEAKSLHDAGQSEEETKLEEGANGIAQYYMEQNGGGKKNEESGGETNPPDKLIVTVDGTSGIKLTKDNIKDYLGRVVTNYKPTASTVTVGANTYTVSTQYRLYYVDFDKKYNKDEVSVFLKADCTRNKYALGQDETSAEASNIKIKALNPALYKTGVTSPTASNANMKAVTWLTNTSNWNSLKTGASLANKVNYVVGAPSLEMMMDSYNIKYGLTNDAMNTGILTADTKRAKLFYQYPYNSNNYGYGVGPSGSSSGVNGYYYFTSNYSVKTDSEIDTMYYPGDNQSYWLASPSANYTGIVMLVRYNNGGNVHTSDYGINYSDLTALCPLVSLQSSASLELQ